MWEFIGVALGGGAGTLLAAKYGRKAWELTQDLLRKGIADKNQLEVKYTSLKQSTKINVINSDNVVIDAAPLLWGTKGFAISREDTLPMAGAMMNPHQRHNVVIKKLKKYLSAKATSATVTAYALIRLENEPRPTKTHLANILATREKFLARDANFKKRVYNNCRSGWMEDILFERAVDMEIVDTPRAEISASLQKAFDDSILTHPMNVYVNEAMSDEDVLAELQRLIQKERRRLVRVYGRGPNWPRVKSLTKSYADAMGLKHHIEDIPIGRVQAGCCRLWDSNFAGTFLDLERECEEEFRERILAASALDAFRTTPERVS